MALEQPAVIDRILAVQILSNLQFSTKVQKFGILSQYQLPVYQAFLAFLAVHAQHPFFKHSDIRGGLSHKPSGLLRSPHQKTKL